ncbi:MAG TPA: MarR family transcriptional regulator [Burkholderiaceae bacterium]|nr:MarR family transcriptional regulator [Burkholderiaceae bacterium]
MDDLSRRLSSRRALRESVVARLLQHVATKLGDYLDASLRDDGLNTTLWMSLLLIYASPDHRLKPSELSVFMNSSRTNSTRVSRELQRHGLVDSIPDEHDKRQQFLELTLKGSTFVEHALPARRQHVQHALGGLTPAEIAELERLLHKLLHRVD